MKEQEQVQGSGLHDFWPQSHSIKMASHGTGETVL